MTDVVKYGGVVSVSRELLGDTSDVKVALDTAIDRWLHPWLYPDRPVWPTFTPVPWLARLQAWWRQRGPKEAG